MGGLGHIPLLLNTCNEENMENMFLADFLSRHPINDADSPRNKIICIAFMF